ncbi:MAG TPA: ABC transporter permease, partial [Baekduia sp.]|nr:ABC transporter permease [Baekduia sp.]
MIAQSGVQIRDRSEEAVSCVRDNGFCPGWIADHWQDYLDPLWRHVQLTLTPVACGFVIAFALALLAHRRRGLGPPLLLVTSVLYTVPAFAFIGVLLVPLGFGFVTALIPLTAYTLAILFRNILAGLENADADVRDAARGMGLTDRQLLWRVELPLALPEILAGVRVATVTTVGLATLAFFAGAGGLG